jgi:hypothetical protein
VMHKVGDLVAVVRYCRVDNHGFISGNAGKNPYLEVTDVDDGTMFSVKGQILIDKLRSADSYNEVKKIPRTKLAEKVSTAFNTPLTVCFDKKDGSERVLRGRLASAEPLMGRSHMEDLDIEKGKHNLRLVDHRTLKWAVIGGTKYEVK